MLECLADFKCYLTEKKAMADNSTLAYGRDINEFCRFLKEKGISSPYDVTNTDIISFLFMLKNSGKSSATVNRKLASLRIFFNYLKSFKGMSQNPTEGIKSPKIERKKIEFMTVEEISRLLDNPDRSHKGLRDKALLETLYASGMRVSEAAGSNLSDVNMRIGFIMVNEDVGKARVIPLGRPARMALEEYIYEARPKLFHGKESECQALFLNYTGERLTRQGIWKIIRENAGEANIQMEITPQTIRNSFAIHMIQNGADIKTLQELLGHEDVTATQVYLSFSKNRIKDVYDSAHPRA
ncbi:site-specific tyrosine recombinase XerD [Bacillota bacterium]